VNSHNDLLRVLLSLNQHGLEVQRSSSQDYANRATVAIRGPNTEATSDITVIIVLRDGPAVSLKESPTVSPTTAALCASEPTPPKPPASMYFLGLSHVPPAFAMNNAKIIPVTMLPARNPPKASLPDMNPITIGTTTGRTPGRTSSLSAPFAAMSTHLV
jgi:hypothetical protein